MGFFDSVQPVVAAAPPASQERLFEALRRLELNYTVDEFDTPIAHYDHGYLLYMLADDQLTVRATFHGSMPTEALPHLSMFAHQWNQFRPYLAAFPVVLGEEGQEFALLTSEQTYPLAAGATDEQLDLMLRGATEAALELFSEIANTFGPTESGE
ncbi:YbjN domain-containing protein [Rothia nasisuis]|uniref:YbjN domain-containing protein n=1 Tax=Rothia nasisuis TaxID=2109647 RepID=UPI001F40DBE4|nr:YbjN domain-containing protein [Rothia nasisuis]